MSRPSSFHHFCLTPLIARTVGKYVHSEKSNMHCSLKQLPLCYGFMPEIGLMHLSQKGASIVFQYATFSKEHSLPGQMYITYWTAPFEKISRENRKIFFKKMMPIVLNLID